MRRDRQRLEDILEALDSVSRIIAGCPEEEFLRNEVIHYAVAQRLTTVGEACARLSSDLTARYGSIPWGDIVGLRNVLVHEYFGILWSSVWLTATEKAPALRNQITEIMRLEFPTAL